MTAPFDRAEAVLDLLESDFGQSDRWARIEALRCEFDKDAKTIDRQARLIEAWRESLTEISKGAGRFDMDPFAHCHNTVEDMKQLAREALALEKEKP